MSVANVERIKQKVEKLVANYEQRLIHIKRLEKENESLKIQIRNMQESLESNELKSDENAALKERVNRLIVEVDNCIQLISK
jgi:cell shape-determining protein MreC